MDKVQSLITYLFVTGEPVTHEALSKYFAFTRKECMDAIAEADVKLAPLGLTIIDDGKEIELRTSPQVVELVEKIRKEEYSRDIGKAGIETLAILLYKGASSRSQIDYIRGVNSSHILRSLSMRGLLRRVTHPKDERSFLYEPTTELLAHLGVAKREDLPDFSNVTAELAALETEQENQPQESTEPDQPNAA
jgi:segregation and condensation protein B